MLTMSILVPPGAALLPTTSLTFWAIGPTCGTPPSSASWFFLYFQSNILSFFNLPKKLFFLVWRISSLAITSEAISVPNWSLFILMPSGLVSMVEPSLLVSIIVPSGLVSKVEPLARARCLSCASQSTGSVSLALSAFICSSVLSSKGVGAFMWRAMLSF